MVMVWQPKKILSSPTIGGQLLNINCNYFNFYCNNLFPSSLKTPHQLLLHLIYENSVAISTMPARWFSSACAKFLRVSVVWASCKFSHYDERFSNEFNFMRENSSSIRHSTLFRFALGPLHLHVSSLFSSQNQGVCHFSHRLILFFQ